MKQNILVTGASTGIGNSIANHLAENGYQVFAGARKPEDIERLSNSDGITGVRLEVTNSADIDIVVSLIGQHGGLYGLINNAGISGTAALLDTPLELHNKLFEVNVFSHLALVKSFFNQLRDNKGKIINISSISSFVGGGTYAATKRSVDAFSLKMANELSKFDIGVSIINPGFFHSQIFTTSSKRSAEFRENSEYYKEDYEEGLKNYNKLKNANIKDPIMVAEKVAQLLVKDNPPLYNLVGNHTEQELAFEGMMNRIKGINEGLDTPWDKEELLSRFDQLLDES